jgi:Erythromycin esterase
VISYLEAVDPEAAVTARKRYSLLSSFRPEVSHYVHALHAGLIKSQAGRVEAVLKDISAKEEEYCDSPLNGDTFFSASENARIVKEAESYYRNSYMGGGNTWFTIFAYIHIQTLCSIYTLMYHVCSTTHWSACLGRSRVALIPSIKLPQGGWVACIFVSVSAA